MISTIKKRKKREWGRKTVSDMPMCCENKRICLYLLAIIVLLEKKYKYIS
tara:strand:+ start:1512 stop:1661 length:150 start_codon:yes stop_codon:yes gene_type:complete